MGAANSLEIAESVQLRRTKVMEAGFAGGGAGRVKELKACVDNVTKENQALKEFLAVRGAKLVKEASSGIGTNEELLIQVLCTCTKTQLDRLDGKFRECYGRALREQVHSDCSGNYKKLLLYSLMDRDEFLAQMVEEACRGIGTNELLLLEVLHTNNNANIAAMKKHWEAKHDKSMTDQLRDELKGDLETLLLKILNGSRNDAQQPDPELAKTQAAALYEAGPGKKFGTDEDVYIDIFSTVSWAQMQEIKHAYEQKYRTSLHAAIVKEFPGVMEDALCGMLDVPIDFLCTRLKEAMNGIGTNETAVARILGGCDKKATTAIKKRFLEKYDVTIENAVKKELSGNFKIAVKYWLDDDSDATAGLEAVTQTTLQTDVGDEEEVAKALDSRLRDLLKENENIKKSIAKTDAQQIYIACVGAGTNEKKLINVMCMRTKQQIDRIDMAYRGIYNMSLREQLEKELTGNFRDFMIFGQMTPDEFDGLMLRKALWGAGTNERVLLEILTTRSNKEIKAAKKFYEDRFDESLTDKIAGDTTGQVRKAFLSLLNMEREDSDSSTQVEPAVAEALVDQLNEAAKGLGTHEGQFVKIMTTTSRAKLTAMQRAYEQKVGRSFMSLLEAEFSGTLREMLIALCSEPMDYLCRVLQKACQGLGTDEATLVRVLGGKDKSTAMTLADRYFKKYDVMLVEEVKKELRGPLRRAMVKWISVFDPCKGLESEADDAMDQLEDLKNIKLDEEADGDDGEDEAAAAAAAVAAAAAAAQAREEQQKREEALKEEAARLEAARAELARLQADAAAAEALAAARVEEKRMEEAIAVAREEERRREEEAAVAREAALAEEQARERRREAREERQAAQLRNRNEHAKSRVAEAVQRYGSAPIMGLTISGKWSDQGYLEANPDVEGDAWENFSAGGGDDEAPSGFMQGRLVKVRNTMGSFVGLFDPSAYAAQHDLFQDLSGDACAMRAWRHFREEGKPANLDMALAFPVPEYIAGQFQPGSYLNMYPDAVQSRSKPRPGRFDTQWYAARYGVPEGRVLDHFMQNKGAIIRAGGYEGKFKKKWYLKKHMNPAKRGGVWKHFKKNGYPKGLMVKVRRVGSPTEPFQHFAQAGYPQQRLLRINNSVGVFMGNFSEEAYAALNPGVSPPGAVAHFEGTGGNAVIGLKNLRCEMLKVAAFGADFENRAGADDAFPIDDTPDDDDDDDDDDDGDDDGDESD